MKWLFFFKKDQFRTNAKIVSLDYEEKFDRTIARKEKLLLIYENCIKNAAYGTILSSAKQASWEPVLWY